MTCWCHEDWGPQGTEGLMDPWDVGYFNASFLAFRPAYYNVTKSFGILCGIMIWDDPGQGIHGERWCNMSLGRH